jgi:hypothetical protein
MVVAAVARDRPRAEGRLLGHPGVERSDAGTAAAAGRVDSRPGLAQDDDAARP